MFDRILNGPLASAISPVRFLCWIIVPTECHCLFHAVVFPLLTSNFYLAFLVFSFFRKVDALHFEILYLILKLNNLLFICCEEMLHNFIVI